ncbi:histidine kinase [Blastococcus sp. TF02-8]|nr:histidine kinase [Blastococcus sp. TF02-8]
MRRVADAAAAHVGAGHATLTVHARDRGADRSAPAPGGTSPTVLALQIDADGAPFATLTLTRDTPFTATDRAAARALAVGAGLAIENARLLEHAGRRRRWALAGTEIASALLSGAPTDQVLRDAAARIAELADADAVGVLVAEAGDDESLRITAAVGPMAAEMEGVRLPLGNTRLQAVHRSGVPELVADAATPVPGTRRPEVIGRIARWYGPALYIPLGAPTALSTLAVLRRRGRAAFEPGILDLASAFATQATVSMELARSQERERRLQLQADRDRIARDLHDHVVQRIFATALALDRLGRSLEDSVPEAAARIAERVDELDGTIARIRTSIFELHGAADSSPDAVRHRLTEVVRSVTEGHGVRPALRVSGAIEDLPAELVPDLVAVVRELVTNVVRHAAAARVTVSVTITDDLRVVVTDDGRGLPSVTVRSGLANLADRAERRGGRLTVSAATSGTEIVWAVPLPG